MSIPSLLRRFGGRPAPAPAPGPAPGGPVHHAILSALHRAVKGTPLALFERVRPGGDTVTESFNALLEDGTEVVFQRRTIAVQRTDALSRGKDGASVPLRDGWHRLKDGIVFEVIQGQIDFEAVLKDPDGYQPFREYAAWKEVVAIDNPLLALSNPLDITDVVRFLAPDGNFYFAVQSGAGRPYQAYVMEGRALRPAADGRYPLSGGRAFSVQGGVLSAGLNDVKVFAHESTRLPGAASTQAP
jgi:hypothetical protein